MPLVITSHHPAVFKQEQVPAMPGHVVELSQAAHRVSLGLFRLPVGEAENVTR